MLARTRFVLSHDLTKLVIVIAGLFGEHQLSSQARQQSDSQSLITAGAVAAQVAEVRDSMITLRRRLEGIECREHKLIGRLEPIGPPEPPKRTGVVAWLSNLMGGR